MLHHLPTDCKQLLRVDPLPQLASTYGISLALRLSISSQALKRPYPEVYACWMITYLYELIKILPTAPIILASLCSADSANSCCLFRVLHRPGDRRLQSVFHGGHGLDDRSTVLRGEAGEFKIADFGRRDAPGWLANAIDIMVVCLGTIPKYRGDIKKNFHSIGRRPGFPEGRGNTLEKLRNHRAVLWYK
jgi:hypothetical protein